MLRYTATNDKKLLNTLNNAIFGEDFAEEVGYVLYDDDLPLGVARMTVTPDKTVLERIGILKEYRGKRIGDFFTRSLINTVSYATDVIEIAYKSDYYKKFGFTEGGSGMTIVADNLTFPCECKGE